MMYGTAPLTSMPSGRGGAGATGAGTVASRRSAATTVPLLQRVPSQ
ncbi:Uncharacterised protein [Mycobacteroides abscessus subsp. abscessus]|nr:Uncharacterised protein [Mycobacteroides abscessus subsp. abscessus]